MKLKDLVDINPVGNGKLPNLIAYIDTSSVADGELTNIQYLQDTFPSRAQRKISNGDILISSVRPNLKHNYYVQNATENMIASTGFIQIRVKNNEKVDSRFLYYWLTSPSKISHYCRIADCSQSSYPSFSKEVIEELDFPSIPLVAQHSITNILGTIDRKIQLNECKIKKLDLLVQDIFDFWFVQYDFPNAQGKPYKSSGGKLVWCNELNRAIPCDWKYSNLYEIADFINGLACQKHRPKCCELSLPVIKIKEMHDGITEHTERATANVPEDYIIHSGDILFSWSATLEVMYWFNTKGVLNQHIFKVVPKEWYLQDYAYRQISQYIRIFKKIAESRKTTMGHITTDHLVQSKIVIPPASVLIEYSKRVSPLLHQIRIISYQLQKLKNIKQNLLPLLMNGQVVVQ